MEKQKNTITIHGHRHIALNWERLPEAEMVNRSRDFYQIYNKRRSVREFSEEAVPKEVIENIIRTASTAPSGANRQPWTFCAVSNTFLKHKIRVAAEAEEKKNYESRMSDRWKKDLEHLATHWEKPFLEEAPWLIVVFKKAFDFAENGEKQFNYYINESAGIACGILISAIHNAGLVTLTYTPSPMSFLRDLLDRPLNERAFLVLPVGYPKDPTYVPDQTRKNLEEISAFYE